MLHRLSRRLAPYFRAISLRILSAWRLLLFAFVTWTLFDTLLVHRRLDSAGKTYLKPQGSVRVYIAGLHWNNERILRNSWNQGRLDLVSVLGPSNVFVSLYESGSRDGSKDAISELDKALGVMGVPRNITLDKTTHADAMASPPLEPGNGWVETPRGRIELRRISYLARIRNKSLQPLKEMAQSGVEFDYILFLGDVVFSVPDVLTLLNTQSDADGHEHATQTWPYFRSSKSRAAMKRSEPVPVSSCWNGIVFMPAASFVGDQELAFRAIDDSLAAKHLEGSECCHIHADNPESETRGVYLNPNVRVGYDRRAYELVHSGRSWLTNSQILYGLWKNRLARWFTTPWFKEWWVRSLERAWQRQNPGRSENGMMCVINEMQVLVHNGWAHV
ncbi:hypothetical protein NCS52_00222100 [Fusarium sp. LHS14.1]|nr:hypothetical protein NCS52_00222100 [Fusarium sp. LHS14.1]